mmetsp:Transcript_27684/g.69809  ORF Transcript_27684/g.69809 Transcript_27684/m.69809 type:complete len:214 (+) Transcript_27684:1028-1669(+)
MESNDDSCARSATYATNVSTSSSDVKEMLCEDDVVGEEDDEDRARTVGVEVVVGEEEVESLAVVSESAEVLALEPALVDFKNSRSPSSKTCCCFSSGPEAGSSMNTLPRILPPTFDCAAFSNRNAAFDVEILLLEEEFLPLTRPAAAPKVDAPPSVSNESGSEIENRYLRGFAGSTVDAMGCDGTGRRNMINDFACAFLIKMHCRRYEWKQCT